MDFRGLQTRQSVFLNGTCLPSGGVQAPLACSCRFRRIFLKIRSMSVDVLSGDFFSAFLRTVFQFSRFEPAMRCSFDGVELVPQVETGLDRAFF